MIDESSVNDSVEQAGGWIARVTLRSSVCTVGWWSVSELLNLSRPVARFSSVHACLLFAAPCSDGPDNCPLSDQGISRLQFVRVPRFRLPITNPSPSSSSSREKLVGGSARFPSFARGRSRWIRGSKITLEKFCG